MDGEHVKNHREDLSKANKKLEKQILRRSSQQIIQEQGREGGKGEQEGKQHLIEMLMVAVRHKSSSWVITSPPLSLTTSLPSLSM